MLGAAAMHRPCSCCLGLRVRPLADSAGTRARLRTECEGMALLGVDERLWGQGRGVQRRSGLGRNGAAVQRRRSARRSRAALAGTAAGSSRTPALPCQRSPTLFTNTMMTEVETLLNQARMS